MALASLDGPPDTVTRRFDTAFSRAAAGRDITIVDPSAARYLVRGYLNAAPSDSGTGTDVTFVYDIFDARDQARLDRVTDTLTLPSADADPWAMVDDRVMASLAGRSADRLAAVLAETPAARAATAAAGVAPLSASAVN